MALLKKGMAGEDVADLQRQLQRLGFDPGSVDGDFGARTRSAVIAFQRARGLEPDGVVGAETRRALDKALKVFAEGDSKKKDPVTTPITIDRSLRLKSGQYFDTRPRKDLIVLHHTAGGSARSTWSWWQQTGSRIATAFIVERDGTILEVFDPRGWAFHLGLKGSGGAVDKRSIGIEIASEGGLKESQGSFYTFDTVSTKNRFDRDPYTHASTWRGYRHFAAYTPQQVGSVCSLVDYLCDEFDIERRTPRNHFDYNADLRSFTGIIGHHHVRADKSDLHPGFDWQQLIDSCKVARV